MTDFTNTLGATKHWELSNQKWLISTATCISNMEFNPIRMGDFSSKTWGIKQEKWGYIDCWKDIILKVVRLRFGNDSNLHRRYAIGCWVTKHAGPSTWICILYVYVLYLYHIRIHNCVDMAILKKHKTIGDNEAKKTIETYIKDVSLMVYWSWRSWAQMIFPHLWLREGSAFFWKARIQRLPRHV